jgi:FAD/FMN-containing dehydrogenase
MLHNELPESSLADLRGTVRGEVLLPGDPGYEPARPVWNAMIAAAPAAIVRAADVADVAPTVALAHATGRPLAIRGGGHNVAGKGTVDGGIVLDMGALRAVEVDPQARTVRVQAGATLADVDAATTPHGLAVPIGVVSATGIAGLTLGGGVGWLTRKHGLTADNLLAACLVTADGREVTADGNGNADLLWALRGGGGNFGVVTEFTFQAHPLGPDVLAANLIYTAARWREAWRALEEWTRDLPDELTVITTTLTPPPVLEAGDEPLLIVGAAWASPDTAAGEALIDRMRTACPPDEEEVGPVPWVQWQTAFDAAFPKGVRAYWRNTSFDRLDDAVIDVLVRRGEEQTWVGTAFDVHLMGGAFARLGQATSPFPNRGARFWLNTYGFWSDPQDDDARVAFVRSMSREMEPFATGGQYVNFMGQEVDGHRLLDPSVVFGPQAHERLVAVKRRFDPDNVFRVNHNISPG